MARRTVSLRSLLYQLVLLLSLAGCSVPPTAAPAPLDATPRVALLSAFQPEMVALRDAADITQQVRVNGRLYHLGTLEGHDVVIGLTGVSMVNAAMTTQTVLDTFNVVAIIVSGIGGGVNPALHVGDVVVPAQWGQYQEQLFARETAGGWDLGGHTAPFGQYGMMVPQELRVTQGGATPHTEREVFWFAADPTLLAAAQAAAGEVEPAVCAGRRCLSEPPAVVVGGNGVSGPTFVDNADYRAWVWATFQADALDMESAAVAHVAYVNDVPFIAFRSLSDQAGGGPGDNEVSLFLTLAAENAAAVVRATLAAWEPPTE